MSLQSPLASLSSFSFVASGALRALGTRQTNTGWVRSGWAGALCWPLLGQESRVPRAPTALPGCPLGTQSRTLKHSLGFLGLQLVLRVPWGLVHPVRRGGAGSEQGWGRAGLLCVCTQARHRDCCPHCTHSFSSVSLLASRASGARRARGPRGSGSTQGTSLTTITLSGESSRAQRRMFQKKQGKVLPD